ncbi:GerMN domain-containing protein [Geodermatophilus sp. DSM 44513]|uniref:GerMN domain-containing protein n=1 Tax=Geodermatophilus sp. DSM 44513 TaxID=1528104 RepID=UPI001412B29A|nr:GerMN domain-containing protein [Geodermatophilus sp. DSM 44513]WNV77669.1 GerMN domain-containing protein [Geodermatophilus sp. DSM 44513]
MTTAARTPTGTGIDARSSGPRLTVYFVRGAVLAPVERPAGAATTAAALEHLVSGPTPREADGGIRTALPPEVIEVDEDLPEGLTTVSVTRGFTGLAGGDQLLAVAQVVWTLTEFPRVTEVRFVVEDQPVEVPADDGLTDQPVDRDDYRSWPRRSRRRPHRPPAVRTEWDRPPVRHRGDATTRRPPLA